MDPRTFGLIAYRAATFVAAPAIPLVLRRRAAAGKEEPVRSGERMGKAGRGRPEGQLVWAHGASVGECLAALPLIEAILERKRANVLVTSGTVASAEVMRHRLPAGAIHQFVPVDTPQAVSRFLNHWRPDIGVFVDSDLWPNLIVEAKERNVPLLLVNARISERSFRGWRWAPRTARTLLSAFDICLAQDETFAERFRALGCPDVRVAGSLKADAPPLTADRAKLDALRLAIGSRPVLLAAQTHPGEDETILPAHDALRREFPQILTIIVPRHTSRGSNIAVLCGTRSVRLRSANQLPNEQTSVYVADTMNELGAFYRLASFAFVGGTLVPMGGHNPLEPARLHRGVLAGPHIFNSASAFEAIFKEQGMGPVASVGEIVALAGRLLRDRDTATALGDAAARGAALLGGAMARTFDAIAALLPADARA
jgi:3-deoxy-D-manno-octulosonic-acid transferase